MEFTNEETEFLIFCLRLSVKQFMEDAQLLRADPNAANLEPAARQCEDHAARASSLLMAVERDARYRKDGAASRMASFDATFWSPDMEESYQKFKRFFEGCRTSEGQAALRSHLKAFRGVNEHHVAMLPILDRLEKEFLGEKDE